VRLRSPREVAHRFSQGAVHACVMRDQEQQLASPHTCSGIHVALVEKRYFSLNWN
jgi:hypothetical protein